MIRVYISLIRLSTESNITNVEIPEHLIVGGQFCDADSWVEENYPGFIINTIQIIMLPSNCEQ